MNTARVLESMPGIGITLAIAAVSFLASEMHPSLDGLVLSIIFGMLFANLTYTNENYDLGIDDARKIFLPLGIGLYGAQLVVNVSMIKAMPVVIIAVGFFFSITYFIARGFGVEKHLAFLLASGISVCGASAIAVVSAITGARKEDISVSTIALLCVGLSAMMFFYFIPAMFDLPAEKFGMLAGLTLPMFGQVKVAASALGEHSLSAATGYKLMRISMLAVLAAGTFFVSGRAERGKRFPWFMAVFFGLAIATNLSAQLAGIRPFIEPVSRFALIAALASIGLSVDLDIITEKGPAPIYAVFVSMVIIIMTVYLLLNVTHV